MRAKETQAALAGILATMIDVDHVKSEWSVRSDATDDIYDKSSYAPRLDLALGPFNVSSEREANVELIRRHQRHPLVAALRREVIRQNHGSFYVNRNPRCLLAIELECSTSSKHILGGITNASLLGYIGIIVGNAQYIAKIRRIYEYACRLREVEKAHSDMFANVACFQKKSFWSAGVGQSSHPAGCQHRTSRDSIVAMEKIHADLIGIGKLLKQTRFTVPPHQRPYAWVEEQVNDLYRDINDAQKRKSEEYFLGTIVLASADDGRVSIIDGQQRLVTVSILLAAIRDHFARDGQTERAQDIEREFLSKRDIRTQESTAHLYLIPEDRDFFVKRAVRPPDHPDRATEPANQAQERIARAIELAAQFVKNLTATTQSPDDVLLDLLEFIENRALLISVAVGDEANAFVIFEVLNDRGLDLSVADLLKNYVFRQAGDRLTEAQMAWESMTTTITDVAGEPDVKVFIRQAWIARNGLTREKQLYDAIKRQVTSKTKVVEYAKRLAADSVIYAALRNPSHDRWKVYGNGVIEALEVLDLVGVTQIRPLLLAIFNNFTVDEVKKALPAAVAWTVRFLICGSGGSGTLETYYAERAREVSTKKIKTAAQLWDGMKSVLPADALFEDIFAAATVSKSNLAKYYLRALEAQTGAKADELIVNPDSEKVNLEHVLPQTYSAAWKHIPQDQHPDLVKRLGNLALMNKRMNSKAANSDFAEKKKYFAESQISLTKELAALPQWTATEIDRRQRMLAKLAVKTWPNKPRG